MNNIIGVSIYGKLYMHHNVASEYTDGEIIYMYKAVNKTKEIWRYIEALSIPLGIQHHIGRKNKICISVVEAKRVTPRYKKKSQ